jgi:hypothetical protein
LGCPHYGFYNGYLTQSFSGLTGVGAGGRCEQKEGGDATVDMSDSKNGEPVSIFIIQIAALS